MLLYGFNTVCFSKHASALSVQRSCFLSSVRQKQRFSRLCSGREWRSVAGWVLWVEHFHTMLCKGQSVRKTATLPAQESKAYVCTQGSIAGFPIFILWSFFTIQFFSPLSSTHLHSPLFPHPSSFSLPTWWSMICIHWYFLIPAGQCSETFPVRSMSERDAQISCSFLSLWLLVLTPARF